MVPNRFIYQLIYQCDIINLVGKYIGKKVGKSMSLTDKIIKLCSYDDEQEWFEFKENWFQPEELGEYVSALSNAAAFETI